MATIGASSGAARTCGCRAAKRVRAKIDHEEPNPRIFIFPMTCKGFSGTLAHASALTRISQYIYDSFGDASSSKVI